jgi:hypothetical protein
MGSSETISDCGVRFRVAGVAFILIRLWDGEGAYFLHAAKEYIAELTIPGDEMSIQDWIWRYDLTLHSKQ